MRSKKWKAAFAALAMSVALLAQPLTASAWMLDAEQQQLVDNLTSGQEALLLGNYAQAVNDLSRAVELNSNSVSAYYYRAKALQYMGRSTDAAADYSRVAAGILMHNRWRSSWVLPAWALRYSAMCSAVLRPVHRSPARTVSSGRPPQRKQLRSNR